MKGVRDDGAFRKVFHGKCSHENLLLLILSPMLGILAILNIFLPQFMITA